MKKCYENKVISMLLIQLFSTMLTSGKCSFSTMLKIRFRRYKLLLTIKRKIICTKLTRFTIKIYIIMYLRSIFYLSAAVLIIGESQNIRSIYQHHIFNHICHHNVKFFLRIIFINNLRNQRNQKFQCKISKISDIV